MLYEESIVLYIGIRDLEEIERGKEVKYEIGKSVKQHANYESSDSCFICGKELKESATEIKIALTENYTLSTLQEIQSTWFTTDFSPRVGNDCVKKFPVEAVFVQTEDGGIHDYI